MFCLNYQYRVSSQFWFLWWLQQKKCDKLRSFFCCNTFWERVKYEKRKTELDLIVVRGSSHIWLIVVRKDSGSTADATVLVNSNDRWDKNPLAPPGMSTALAATSTVATTATGRKRCCWSSTPVSYSNLLMTPFLLFTKVKCIHIHHCREILPRL